MDIREILNHCDHTLLAQTATWEEIKAILDDGIKYNVASCCIPPSFVKRAKEYVGDKLSICTVIGFPNGYNTADVKLFETEQALKEGADEIDMVVNIGDVKEHNFEKVTDEIRLLKNACGKKVTQGASTRIVVRVDSKAHSLVFKLCCWHEPPPFIFCFGIITSFFLFFNVFRVKFVVFGFVKIRRMHKNPPKTTLLS